MLNFFSRLRSQRNATIAFLCAALCFVNNSDAAVVFPSKKLYFGINLGGGSTEWKYLVDTTDPSNSVSTTTPAAVSEGGPSWGVVFGFDISKNFAIEMQYMQFANADIQLGANSSYVDQNDNSLTSITSETSAYSLSGKFFAQIADTAMRAFAAAGAGLVQRTDPLVNYNDNYPNPPPFSNYTGNATTISCVTPYLSAGLNYTASKHWMIESGFQYYTGFGRSQLDPVASFIPFAWDAYGRIAYEF
jgi:hypothetical protein